MIIITGDLLIKQGNMQLSIDVGAGDFRLKNDGSGDVNLWNIKSDIK